MNNLFRYEIVERDKIQYARDFSRGDKIKNSYGDMFVVVEVGLDKFFVCYNGRFAGTVLSKDDGVYGKKA